MNQINIATVTQLPYINKEIRSGYKEIRILETFTIADQTKTAQWEKTEEGKKT